MSVSLIDGHIDDDTMTDEQIIKALEDNRIVEALECCLSDNPPCFACKYDGDTTTVDECMGELMKDALDLINRQKAEIERLNKQLVFEIESAYDRGTKAAVKEFAKRLKKNKYYGCNRLGYGTWVVEVSDIDNLVKRNGG